MNVLISGQAGKAIIIQGNEASVLDVYKPQEELVRLKSTIPHYFSGTNDIEFYDIKTKREVEEKLLLSWQSNLSLQLFLIYLDHTEDADTRLIAAEDLSIFFENINIIEYLSNVLYSSPFPEGFNSNDKLFFEGNFPQLKSYFQKLKKDQNEITIVRRAWDEIPLTHFKGNPQAKEDFKKEAVIKGFFKSFVEASSDSTKFGLAWINCQFNLGYLTNSREILQAWVKPFQPSQPEVDFEESYDERDEEFWSIDKSKREFEPAKGKAFRKIPHEVKTTLESIEKQKTIITDLLIKGDLEKAREIVDGLIKFQLKRGRPEHLAKTLSHLSKLAKDHSQISLQLEWAKLAYQIWPEDAIVHCHIADANIGLFNYEEAFKWLKSARGKGEPESYITGLARIYKNQGKLDKALNTYREAIKEFPYSIVASVGEAEVLRELWDLEGALETYNRVMRLFPNEPIPQTGKASVLKDLGNFKDASKMFEKIIEEFGTEYGYAGKAEVAREMGDFDNALKFYAEAIKKIPSSRVLHNGLASVLKDMKRYGEAVDKYEEISLQFPYDSVSWSGKGEVFKESGRLKDALQIYSEGLEKFPDSNVMWTGMASVLKRMGRFDDSLQKYDQTVAKFPYSPYALSGRADLLKELGKLPEALKAYDKVAKISPKAKKVPHAKAAVFVAMNKFNEAEELLPLDTPKTFDDWIAYHVRCMILLKTHKIEEAEKRLKFGFEKNPFASQKRYFENALTVVTLKQEKFEEAHSYVGQDQRPLTNVIRIHLFGETKQIQKAKKAYEDAKIGCTPILSKLRDALAIRYNIVPGRAEHSKDWYFQQECDNILLKAA